MEKFNKLSRAEMKKVLGGLYDNGGGSGGGTTLLCSCTCNSGYGVQPSFTLVVENYDYRKTYTPSAAACGCTPIYIVQQPGYNSSGCGVEYYA
ncbi:MAG: hypothetical protein WC615_23015 [Mucilaginibacter sp.]|jgi:hypothetical protein|uniref:hypothetical protein n=1 Tax=Mucilaginibacter sp. TaxID=1882438 RepID=UPI003569F114